jgi:hypothetical protein
MVEGESFLADKVFELADISECFDAHERLPASIDVEIGYDV